ncbi:MAG: helix-turn-helix domain-containing protein [Myxococcota bacterium]
MSQVLVVEDDAVYREVVGRTLEDAGFLRWSPARTSRGRGPPARRPRRTVALVDLRLGGDAGAGLEVVRLLAAAAPGCRAVVLTGHGTIPVAVEAMRAGAVDFRTKPIDGGALVEALREALVPLPSETLEEVERNHILSVLQATGGNISETARRLGLYRRTLQRKLQKLPPAR